MEPLHKVTTEELPILLEWLSERLPDTIKMYGNVWEELKGRWQGTTHYTLGWPDIRAIGEGPVDKTKSKCADFFNHTRHTCVYAPKPEHAEELLLRPDFLDWTKPILFHCVPYETAKVVEKVSKATGSQHLLRLDGELMAAYPGDIAVRPVPEDLDIRPLTPDLLDYIESTWSFRRKHTEQYLSEVIKSLPTVGIYNRNGDCVGFEIGNEYGFAALLYVKEEARGRGLASCITSHLAQKYFEENRPILVAIVSSNKPSLDMHTKLGFKTIGKLRWFVHSMGGEKIMQLQY